MTILANSVGEMQNDLADSQKLVERIDKAMKRRRARRHLPRPRVGARTKSVEMLNSAVDIRQKLAGKLRTLLDPTLSDEERKQLDVIAVQRDGLQRQLSNAPTTDAAVKEHETAGEGRLR